jgi:hypothetical protein
LKNGGGEVFSAARGELPRPCCPGGLPWGAGPGDCPRGLARGLAQGVGWQRGAPGRPLRRAGGAGRGRRSPESARGARPRPAAAARAPPEVGGGGGRGRGRRTASPPAAAGSLDSRDSCPGSGVQPGLAWSKARQAHQRPGGRAAAGAACGRSSSQAERALLRWPRGALRSARAPALPPPTTTRVLPLPGPATTRAARSCVTTCGRSACRRRRRTRPAQRGGPGGGQSRPGCSHSAAPGEASQRAWVGGERCAARRTAAVCSAFRPARWSAATAVAALDACSAVHNPRWLLRRPMAAGHRCGHRYLAGPAPLR